MTAAAPARVPQPATTGSGLALVDLHVQIPLPGTPRRWVHAARGLNLLAPAGEVTAVVGESGCGKSVLGLAAMGLLPAGTRVSGSIEIDGRDVVGRSESELVGLRGRSVGMVPQSAATHLTPVRSIGSQLAESLRHHRRPHGPADLTALLAGVGLAPEVRDAYPLELSGGMAQRAVVALTMALEPAVLVADEPTSALDDASAGVVLRMLRAHADHGHAVVLITHDLAAARSIADRVAVMYAGELLEVGPSGSVLGPVGAAGDRAPQGAQPKHDYTRALLDALPENGLHAPPGMPSSLVDPDPGACAWHIRAGRLCDHAPLRAVAPGHEAACGEARS